MRRSLMDDITKIAKGRFDFDDDLDDILDGKKKKKKKKDKAKAQRQGRRCQDDGLQRVPEGSEQEGAACQDGCSWRLRSQLGDG